MTDANPNQAEMQGYRAKILELTAWRDSVRAAFARWKELPVMNIEKTQAAKEMERTINATTATQDDNGSD